MKNAVEIVLLIVAHFVMQPAPISALSGLVAVPILAISILVVRRLRRVEL